MTDTSPRRVLRIIHVASSYPLTASDSTAPFMAEMLEALAARGHDVSILVPRTSGLEEGNRNGVRVVGIPYAPPPLHVWGYGRSLDHKGRLRPTAAFITPLVLGAMGLAVRRLVRQVDPDVVHLHWVLPLGILDQVVPRKTPVVISSHGSDARFSVGRLQPFARAALTRADAVVAASREILKVLATVQSSVGSKAHVIPHGANAALFHPRSRDMARSRLGIEPRYATVVGIGRLIPDKGFDALIASLPHLGTPNAQLYLVGNGPDRGRLESLVTEETKDRIHFIGAADREKVADWYAAADVVVIPSRSMSGHGDTGPVVLVEALAAGRPVVASPIGMVPDLLEPGRNGYVVRSDDPASWASAIDDAIADSARLGAAARSTFERVGDWDRVAESLEVTYGKAMERRR